MEDTHYTDIYRMSSTARVLRNLSMKLSVTKGISQVGSAAGAHGMESASLKSGNILDRMGALEVRNRDSIALNEIFTTLHHIGNESIVSKQESSIKHIAIKLRNIGISSIQEMLQNGSMNSNMNISLQGRLPEHDDERYNICYRHIRFYCGYQTATYFNCYCSCSGGRDN